MPASARTADCKEDRRGGRHCVWPQGQGCYGGGGLPWGRQLIYSVELMSGELHLGEFEQIVLLAVVRLGDGAYGVPIRREIEERTGRKVTVGALYATLDRLEAKGFVSSWFADPTAERGGRSRRYFRVEPAGIESLARARDMFERMWKGVRLA